MMRCHLGKIVGKETTARDGRDERDAAWGHSANHRKEGRTLQSRTPSGLSDWVNAGNRLRGGFLAERRVVKARSFFEVRAKGMLR